MRTSIVACAMLVAGCGQGGPGAMGDLGGLVGDLGGVSGELGGGSGDGGGGCLGSELVAAVGSNTLLVGASMGDTTAAAAPFDLRYLYISGQFPDQGQPCASCLNSCSTTSIDNGMNVVHPCTNAGGGCGWWGCWQYDRDPPGGYVPSFITAAQRNNQIPMLTYYVLLQASGVDEVAATEVGVANDAAFMRLYFDHFRFFLQRIGSAQALLHLEPDFWGYAELVNGDPHATPARVASANATDCAGQEDSIAGFARCLVGMVRKYAPNAKVGLHGSAWGTNMDVLTNTRTTLDVAAEARTLGGFLTALGAGETDFIAVDASDRDADWYRLVRGDGGAHWWDATNAKLPHFHQAFAWMKALAENVGKPIVVWQVPVGNEAQSSGCDHYKDNRVDYFFAHTDELVAAHVAAIAFGSGAGCQTNPETDGGNLINKVAAYAQSGRRALCP